jgi:transketolase N-terminal domain/subunit
VIAWGKESFTLEHCELEGGCQLALVFTLSHGVITRLLMIEDLRSFLRSGGSLGEAPAAARRMAAVSTGSLGRAYGLVGGTA